MTLPDPFARLDPVTQEVKYSPGESLETVFPGEAMCCVCVEICLQLSVLLVCISPGIYLFLCSPVIFILGSVVSSTVLFIVYTHSIAM